MFYSCWPFIIASNHCASTSPVNAECCTGAPPRNSCSVFQGSSRRCRVSRVVRCNQPTRDATRHAPLPVWRARAHRLTALLLASDACSWLAVADAPVDLGGGGSPSTHRFLPACLGSCMCARGGKKEKVALRRRTHTMVVLAADGDARAGSPAVGSGPHATWLAVSNSGETESSLGLV